MDHGPNFRCLSAAVGRFIRPASAGRGDSRHFPIGDFADPNPGGCHPIVETHVQEHGMYILQGEGMYLMDDVWMGIKKDDFIWFGAYAAQCAYGVGTEPFTYIYSKDCNRDVVL